MCVWQVCIVRVSPTLSIFRNDLSRRFIFQWMCRLIDRSGRFPYPSGVSFGCHQGGLPVVVGLLLGPLVGSMYSPESGIQTIAVLPGLSSLCQC